MVFLYLASEKPNPTEFSLFIKPWCASVWFDLGILLDIPLYELKQIKLSGSKDCCMRMFMKWLKSNSDATWDDLLKEVNNVLFDTLNELITVKSKFYSCITMYMPTI